MKKILIVDDHTIVREGLKRILADVTDIAMVDEAGSGREAMDKAQKNRYDVVLLDISMPEKSGLEVLKQLKVERPGLPILVLTMYPEEQYAVRALRAGASGYVTKENTPEELIKAIRKVMRGGKYVSPSLAEKLAYDLEIGAEKPLHERLSDREYEVMCMIAAGKRTKEIAQELSLSVKTISTYRSRILEKMKMRSNAELTHYVIKNHLLELFGLNNSDK